MFGLGKISDIIKELKERYKTEDLSKLSANQKLDGLCQAMQLSYSQLDHLIATNSPVLRTIKGHAFEVVFDYLMLENGYKIKEVGGDVEVDRIVNNITLQLKTPTLSGTKDNIVQYKTHHTHGAKSEQESLTYYHSKDNFAQVLVGLVSYKPLRILFLKREELPTHPKDSNRILSPFSIRWDNHPGLNAFERIGIKNIDLSSTSFENKPTRELLPLTSDKLKLKTEIILDTILRDSNFRIWDMNIRGFARETVFRDALSKLKIAMFSPTKCRKTRGDKSDIALMSAKNKGYIFLQVKGVSLNLCRLNASSPIIAIETQLTRGRVNDHPTQSRLYLTSDFDYLILCLDPCLVNVCSQDKKNLKLCWEFYAIPIKELTTHPKLRNRLKSAQFFKYSELQKYRIDEKWFSKWAGA